MNKSQFSILIANLFIIGGLLASGIIIRLTMLFLAVLWAFSAVIGYFQERQKAIIFQYKVLQLLEFLHDHLKKNGKGRKHNTKRKNRHK